MLIIWPLRSNTLMSLWNSQMTSRNIQKNIWTIWLSFKKVKMSLFTFECIDCIFHFIVLTIWPTLGHTQKNMLTIWPTSWHTQNNVLTIWPTSWHTQNNVLTIWPTSWHTQNNVLTIWPTLRNDQKNIWTIWLSLKKVKMSLFTFDWLYGIYQDIVSIIWQT